jgi:hypothetical protein
VTRFASPARSAIPLFTIGKWVFDKLERCSYIDGY